MLRGVSFAIEEGSVCALVGKSGGGKSTMVHLLLRYYDPSEGRLTLGGIDYTQLSLSSLHAHIGVVSQETNPNAALQHHHLLTLTRTRTRTRSLLLVPEQEALNKVGHALHVYVPVFARYAQSPKV